MFLRTALLVLWKDFAIEAKSLEILSTTLFFAMGCVLVFAFALVKDSQWFEKGRMGWWGCVHDEKDQGEWNRKVSQMIDDLPSDTLMSVYDCHI